jgi:uncharacterized protein YndB with AHSA1/START domain
MNATSDAEQRQRIKLERTLRAPVERVWRLWTTKEGLEKWWGPEGFASIVNRIDVRVGGGYEIAMTAVRADIVAYLESSGAPLTSHDRGDYTEVVEHARLAWTSGVDFIPGVPKYDSDSSVDMRPLADGGTHLVVTLEAMHDGHWTKMKTMGWEQQLAKLEQLLAERA